MRPCQRREITRMLYALSSAIPAHIRLAAVLNIIQTCFTSGREPPLVVSENKRQTRVCNYGKFRKMPLWQQQFSSSSAAATAVQQQRQRPEQRQKLQLRQQLQRCRRERAILKRMERFPSRFPRVGRPLKKTMGPRLGASAFEPIS